MGSNPIPRTIEKSFNVRLWLVVERMETRPSFDSVEAGAPSGI